MLQEYKRKNKANKLIDKRFGENDPDMDPEEKMLKRFALEKRVSRILSWNVVLFFIFLHASKSGYVHNALISETYSKLLNI